MTAAGKKAERRAVAALERAGHDPELMGDAIERYVNAVEDVVTLRTQWDAIGRPGLTAGGATGSAEVAHPLVRQIHEAEKLASGFGAEVGLTIKVKRGPGRPVSSDRELPPKLAVVK